MALRKKTARTKGKRVLKHARKKYDDDEETEVVELATGENAPMFWGDVDKKLLRKHSGRKITRTKMKRRRSN